MRKLQLVLLVLASAASGGLLRAQDSLGQLRPVPPRMSGETTNWRGLAISVAAQGAASGFDAWTSWNRPERNGFLASGGRFDASSAYKKAGMLAGVTVLEILVVKKWGKRHPWIERACRVANFTSAGMLASAGVHNIRNR
jgi:hypothetical protein